jgi:rfaE bifunctional protein kinase chain/domain
VPVVHVQREQERLGGAANVALNVKTLGAQTTLLTVVGEDEPARILQRLLNEQSIDSVLGRDPQLRTIVKLRVVARSQQLLRLDFENQPGHELLAQLLADYQRVLGEHDVVLLSDYGKGGLAHVSQMIGLARAAGKAVLVDPKGREFARYAGATLVTPNRAELALGVGDWHDDADLQRRAERLRSELQLDGLLVTRSEQGMSLFDADGHLHEPAQAQQVFDVTGAGDTAIATMAVMLASGLSLRQAVPVANRAGGLVVSRFGTAALSYEELFG